MRWTVIVLLFLAAASAKYAKKNRFLKNFGDEVEDWTDDEDFDESGEEDDYRPQERKCQLKNRNRCSEPKRRTYDRSDSSEEDSHERDLDEKRQPCRPNYDLLQKLDQINHQFAAKLHRGAKRVDDDKNTALSPIAVQLALAALSRGAHGNTRRQIDQLLNYGLPKREQSQNAHAALMRSLKEKEKNLQIKSTTSIVLGHRSARDQFIEAIKNCFDGEVKKCDFRNRHQQCRDQINQWVATKTGQKSAHPLGQHDLTANTKMISVGTLHVKAGWSKQVRKNLKTAQGQFYPLGESKPIQVKVFRAEGDFNYYEDEQMSILGLPTQEKQLTVYVILPKDRDGLNRLEKQRIQYGQQVQQLLDECDSRKQSLRIQLPVFQIAYTIDAKEILRKVGMEDAFDGDLADFSNLAEEIDRDSDEQILKYGRRTGGLEDVDSKKHPQLHLNKFIQHAAVQVDENGLDAVQPSKKQTKSDDDDRDDEIEFRADHAFAYIIKHNPSNQIILIGRVVDATQPAETEKAEYE